MPRTTVWILGDQLLADHPALRHAASDPAEVQVVLIESAARLRRLPYQRKKLTLLLSAMRHYADDLRARGYRVDYRQAPTFLDGLRAHLTDAPAAQLVTMASASYDGRQGQLRLSDRLGLPVTVLPNTQFLVGRFNPIPNPAPGKRYVLEQFYRAMRRHFGVLLDDDGQPVSGRWNYDAENRRRLPANRRPPQPIAFAPDAVTQTVMAEVNSWDGLTGTADGFAYAVTRAQARAALDDFIAHRLADFGPYEDALTTRSHALYHSLLSPYLNIGLLEPLEVIAAVEQAYREGRAPIASAEAMVRQVLGWREFMYWQYWRQMPGMTEQNAWDAHRPLPPFVWTGDTDLRCVRHAVQRALETGYNHHIERLMVLGNLFMLSGCDPRAVNDWFLSLYIDAYEWVMPPNVIGMTLNADGGLTATKPYIAGANYINTQSDYCAGCAYDPKQRTGPRACPFNTLYWNFLLRHEARLRANPRSGPAVLGLRHLDAAERLRVQEEAAQWLEQFAA